MLEASDTKIGKPLGFANFHHKITPRSKVGVALSTGASKKLEVPFNISVMSEVSEFKFGIELGFAKYNYKMTP